MSKTAQLGMRISPEEYKMEASGVIIELEGRYLVRYLGYDGREHACPPPYAINKNGNQPFMAAKSSPEDLVEETHSRLNQYDNDPSNPLVGSSSELRGFMAGQGLGIDCSNFAYRVLDQIYLTLLGKPYSDYIFRSTEQIRQLMRQRTDSWSVSSEFDTDTTRKLSAGQISITELCGIFTGKSPEYLIGARHMAGQPDAEHITDPRRLLPGDLIVFYNSAEDSENNEQKAVHVGVISGVFITAENDSKKVRFVHSCETKDPAGGGLRSDKAILTPDGLCFDDCKIGPDQFDPFKYASSRVVRPKELALLTRRFVIID